MNKLIFKKWSKSFLCTAMSGVLFSSASVWAEGDHHKHSTEFSSQKVTDNIHLLQGKGGNIAVLKGDKGLLLIDSDYQEMSKALSETLEAYGGKEKVTYVINTHWHGDHTEGNHMLGRHSTIVAHDNVRQRLLTRQEVKLFNAVKEPYPEESVPSITYESAMSLHFAGEHVKLIHFPSGHTDGDTVVYFKGANVVHMGDHFFSGMFPFVDVQNGGNVLNMAANVKQVIATIDNKTKIIPGHGPLSGKRDLQKFHDMLVGTSLEVKTMMDKGMSLEEIQKNGLDKKWASWAKGLLPEPVWIGIVHSSLMSK